MEESLALRLARHATHRGNEVAFRFLSRHKNSSHDLTWAGLWHAAQRQAAQLAALGLRDKHVGILCPNPGDFVVSLVAIALAGAVAVPMPAVLSRRSVPRISGIMRAAELAAVIAPGDTLDEEWISQQSMPLRIKPGVPQSHDSEAVDDWVPPPHEPAKPLLLQFTSGSTGAPTGVVLSHANVASNCAAIAAAYGLTPEDVGLSWLPLHHDMGLVGHVLMPIWLGGRSVLMDSLLFLQRPLRWLRAIGEERASITSAPNFAYELCNRAAVKEMVSDLDLSCLKTAICGGEPVVSATIDEFVRQFSRYGFRRSAFAPSYGLAEATLLVATDKNAAGPTSLEAPERRNPSSPTHVTSVGRPVAGTRIRITDQTSGTIISDGRVGEIEVAGASVGRVLGSDPCEWVKTGDLGFLSSGRLFVAGRSKELLILRGQNVFPIEIEAAALKASPAIVAGGVAAVGIERDGTQALVLIVEVRLRTESNTSSEDLKRTIRQAIALETGHVPDEAVLVDPGSLPRTTSGKLRRLEIRARYQSRELAEHSVTDKDSASLEHV